LPFEEPSDHVLCGSRRLTQAAPAACTPRTLLLWLGSNADYFRKARSQD
jgi:hypothetical protein